MITLWVMPSGLASTHVAFWPTLRDILKPALVEYVDRVIIQTTNINRFLLKEGGKDFTGGTPWPGGVLDTEIGEVRMIFDPLFGMSPLVMYYGPSDSVGYPEKARLTYQKMIKAMRGY